MVSHRGDSLNFNDAPSNGRPNRAYRSLRTRRKLFRWKLHSSVDVNVFPTMCTCRYRSDVDDTDSTRALGVYLCNIVEGAVVFEEGSGYHRIRNIRKEYVAIYRG